MNRVGKIQLSELGKTRLPLTRSVDPPLCREMPPQSSKSRIACGEAGSEEDGWLFPRSCGAISRLLWHSGRIRSGSGSVGSNTQVST
jgi:hypothetical protein